MKRALTQPATPPSLAQSRRDRLPYWFARISRALSQQLAHRLGHEFGLNLAEYRILSTLSDFGSASIKDISAEASLDKAQVTRAIAQLTQRKLVVQVVDGRDRRLRVVRLTNAGRALHEATLPFVEARNRRLIRDLSPAELQVLWKAVKRISDEAHRMLREEAAPGAKRRGRVKEPSRSPPRAAGDRTTSGRKSRAST